MAGLLDEDEKSWVGQAFDGLLSNLTGIDNYLNEGFDAIARELKIDQGGAAYAKNIVDGTVQGLKNIGVPDSVFEIEPATTEANFGKSSDRFLQNIPAHAPKVAKGLIDMIASPIETSNMLLDFAEGAINAAIPDDSLLQKGLDWTDSLIDYNNKPNQEMFVESASKLKELASTEQGRRTIVQEYPIDWIFAGSALRAGLNKIPNISPEFKAKVKDDFIQGVNPEDIINNVTKFMTPSGRGIMSDMKSQIFAGETAAIRLGKTAELDKAKQLASEGVSAEEIWKQTGFGLAQDGKWRMELDDSQSSLKPLDVVMDANLSIKGDELLDYKDLIKTYPEVSDVDVYPYKFNLAPSTFGYYAEKAGVPEIGLNPVSQKTLEEYSLDSTGKAILKKGKTLHEVQHLLQAIEGNAGGSSPAMEAGKVFIEENLPDIRSQITNIQLQIDALDPSSSQRVPLLNKKTELEKKLVTQDQYVKDKGFENYKNTLGELEAFQTQADVALTAEQRANRLPAYLQNKDARFADSGLALGTNNNLLNQIEPQSLVKSTAFKRRNDGTYVGFSPALDTPQKLNKLISQLDKLAVEGKDARMWYEDSSNQILNLVQGDVVEAEKIAQIIAITSQGASVETNTGFAFKAYSQYKAGLPIEAGRFPAAQSKKIEAILNGGSWEGRKTNSFYRNLMVEIDPSKLAGTETTQDMWMARAFGLDSEVPGGAQYEIMERITQSIANKHGYKPHQAQAAIWVAVKARNDAMKSVINATVKEKGWGNNANDIFPQFQKKFDNYFQKTVYDGEYNVDEFLKASYSFADGIEDNLGYINLEAVPGTTTNLLPGIATASAEDVAAYTKDMYSIFLDKDGVDLLAKEVGIVSPGNFLGFGGWKGDTNPNVQVRGILSGTQAGGINKADIELVETYAAIVGTVFKQDGVSYRRAFADKTVGKQNAVDIDIGRTLTKDESVRLYDELTKQFGNDLISPTSSANGAEIINYTQFEDMPISNADFKKMVKQAIIDADLGDVDIGYFRSEGNLLMNDWKENPNGEQYKNRENITSKSQAVYERMVNQYGKDAETINARYKKDYGW